MDLKDKTLKVWNKAKGCNCDVLDCEQNHKSCGICGKTIIFGSHVSNQPNSDYAWDVDHINKKSNSGSNDISNLRVVHVSCNRNRK